MQHVSQGFKGILLAIVILSSLQVAIAAPYGPNGMTTTFRQPDGTVITLKFYGDEFYARGETVDGYTVVFDKTTKSYEYARRSKDGQTLLGTGVLVGQGKPSALGLKKHIDMKVEARRAIAQARFKRWDEATGNSKEWAKRKAAMQAADKKRRAASSDGVTPANTTTYNDAAFAPPGSYTLGNKVGLTLLIDFSDDPATVSQPAIDDFCNANTNSVKAYFYDNSSGKLTYTNVVTAYVRMIQPKSYYNDTGKDAGDQANLLIKDAITIMKSQSGYDASMFNDLTVDGSSQAVACNVFYAGGNGGSWSMGLWPHSWSLYNVGSQDLGNGKKIFKYQVTNIGSALEVGTFCHENGHMLCGYPDIYDYDYDSVGGAGIFCLMNSGGHGNNPVLISAYLRRASGWTTTTEITSTDNFTASLTATVGDLNFNKIYRYAKPGTPTEYFLFENRQKTGRDANISASGIAIWHVDELGNKDNQSLVPNTSHSNYECSLIQADNQWHFQKDLNAGDSRDLYYLGNNASTYTNSFNDASSPDANWWSGAYSGIQAYDFSASGATMTFTVGLPADTIIVMSPNGGENILSNSVHTISWSANITGNVLIELYKAGSLHSVLSVDEANDGSYPWIVPASLPLTNDYTIRVSSVDNSSIVDVSNASFSIVANSLPEAVDAIKLPWGTTGGQAWFSQAGTTHDGVDAAQSASIADGQITSLETTVTGPGTLTFWWKVSSEVNWDFLIFYMNNVEQGGSLAKISGNVDWVQKTVSIPAGSNTLKWSYVKDESFFELTDAAWVDQVVYTPDNPDADMSVTRNGSVITNGGTDTLFNTENGVATQLTYKISNSGWANLTMTTPITATVGANCSVVVDTEPGSPVTTSGSTDMVVTVTPTANLAWSATISIGNNDPNDNPYDWTISGTAAPTYALTVSGGTGDGNYAAGFDATITADLPSAGQQFKNWTVVSGGGTFADANAPSTTYTMPANIATVTANYEIADYTLTYTAGANGSVDGISPQTVIYGGSGSAVTAVPDAGYHFVSWSDGSTVNPRTDSNVTADITVTAGFAGNIYILSYTAGPNGRLVITGDTTVTHGADGATVTAVPDPGYIFEKWSDGSAQNPRPNANVTADVTVEANFLLQTIPAVLTTQAATAIGTTTAIGNGSLTSLGTPNPSAHGMCWNTTGNPTVDSDDYTNENATVSTGAFSSKIVGLIPGTIYYVRAYATNLAGNAYGNVETFETLSTSERYILTYNGNGNTGGTVPIDLTEYAFGQGVTVLNKGTMTRTGYSFLGWNTEPDGSGDNYSANEEFLMPQKDLFLYAEWALSSHTITYYGNGHTGGNPPTDTSSPYTYGSTVTILNNTGSLVNTGYYFAGWNTQANGGGTSYGPGFAFAMGDADLVLYAQWSTTVPTFTVTYDGNGADGGTAPVDSNTYLVGTTVTVLAKDSLTKAGNNFVSWNTSADGSGTKYLPDSTFASPFYNVTLYAQWARAGGGGGGGGGCTMSGGIDFMANLLPVMFLLVLMSIARVVMRKKTMTT